MLIFNFHHVEPDPPHPTKRFQDRKQITITPEGLKNIIKTLRILGMKIVSLEEVIDQGGPEKYDNTHVLFTLDDGYENNYLYGVPVFESENCPATIFALPGHFSGSNEWDQGSFPLKERDQLMSLSQIKEIALNYPLITFGSHGLYHNHLPQLSRSDLKQELYDSYDILSQELGNRFLPAIAYPWGEYSDHVLDLMVRSPYTYGFTTEKGSWKKETPMYQIPRYSAYYRDGQPLIFLLKLLRNNLLPTQIPFLPKVP